MKVNIDGVFKSGARFNEDVEVPDEVGCGPGVLAYLVNEMKPLGGVLPKGILLANETGVLVFDPEDVVFIRARPVPQPPETEPLMDPVAIIHDTSGVLVERP